VPNLTENYTIFRIEVIGGTRTPIKELLCVAESEITLVVAVAFLIIGNEDILVTAIESLGFEGILDKFVKGNGEIDSIHISCFVGYTTYIANTVPKLPHPAEDARP
jgi:hypothetical protein